MGHEMVVGLAQPIGVPRARFHLVQLFRPDPGPLRPGHRAEGERHRDLSELSATGRGRGGEVRVSLDARGLEAFDPGVAVCMGEHPETREQGFEGAAVFAMDRQDLRPPRMLPRPRPKRDRARDEALRARAGSGGPIRRLRGCRFPGSLAMPATRRAGPQSPASKEKLRPGRRNWVSEASRSPAPPSRGAVARPRPSGPPGPARVQRAGRPGYLAALRSASASARRPTRLPCVSSRPVRGPSPPGVNA